MFGNIYNGTNLPRSCFEIKVSINYLTNTFDFFHFDANFFYIGRLLIHNTGQEKVIPVTQKQSEA